MGYGVWGLGIGDGEWGMGEGRLEDSCFALFLAMMMMPSIHLIYYYQCAGFLSVPFLSFSGCLPEVTTVVQCHSVEGTKGPSVFRFFFLATFVSPLWSIFSRFLGSLAG
jgi:hypothetical protein